MQTPALPLPAAGAASRPEPTCRSGPTEVAASPVVAATTRKARDLRIDALRGLSLLMIFVDHVPSDFLNWYTLHNFSLSDAAEVFVFLAGTSSTLAYGRAFERQGAVAGLRKIAARCGKIYFVQVALFSISLAISWGWRHTGHATPIIGPVADAGWAGILRGLLLNALPTYLDILPLYVVLLATFPLVHAMTRLSPWLALGVSGAIWLEVNIWHNLNLPNMLAAEGWYFNPFAWQFLFTIGAVSAAGMASVRRVSAGFTLLRVLCSAYLAFGLLEAVNWAHWGLPNLSPFDIGEPSKSLLSPLRLLSVIALIFLLFSSPAIGRLSERPEMRLVVLCGRHSLAVFAAGCLLAYASRLLFTGFGESWWLQGGVNVVGLGGMFAAASWLERRRVRVPPQPPKDDLAGLHGESNPAIEAGTLPVIG